MKFDLKMSVSISEATMKEMVKKVVEEQTGQTVKTVTFKVSTEFDVRGDTYVQFQGCEVEFDTNTNTLSR